MTFIKLFWCVEKAAVPSRDETHVLVLAAGLKRVAIVHEYGGWELLDVPPEVVSAFENNEADKVLIRGDNDGQCGNYPNEAVPRTIEDCRSAEAAYIKLHDWKKKKNRRRP